MKVWGLTGGIGTGKSTVGAMFTQCGASVLSADATYHTLLEPLEGGPSPLTTALQRAFGPMFAPVSADGRLDRRTLGAHVFGDPSALALLESITHPAISEATQKNLLALRQGGTAHAIYDVPLLFEKGLQAGFAGIVLVWVPPVLQLERVVNRDQCSRAAAEARIAVQWPLETKRALARWVVDNSRDLAATREQVNAVWMAMQRT